MFRDQDDTSEQPATRAGGSAGGAVRSYPLRQFLAYQRLIEKGERTDPERVVADYLKANPTADLEAPYTFAQWQARASR